jgi:catechol 2,3-dioxygenase-like lactoylglutathione lyase family enzyme
VIVGFHSITLAAKDADTASAALRGFLGVGATPAGAAEAFHLGNVALRIRPTADEQAEGLRRVTFGVVDLERACRTLERRGAPTRREGEEAILDTGASHGVELAVAAAGRPTGGLPPADAIVGLDHVVIRTPDPERAIALYSARLGLDFRLDRSNPAWGSRLLFFRCGDAVVEIAADPRAPRSDGPDLLSGLAFRARDPDAVRARLTALEMDVSEVRTGRKPGTRVFTVRSGVIGAPALVIGAALDQVGQSETLDA